MKDDSSFSSSRRWFTLGSVLTLACAAAGAAASPTGGQASASTAPQATSPNAPRTLLVLGDSLSAEYGLARGTGWVPLLEKRLAERAPDWTVVNASISGETTAGGVSRIGELLARVEPALVIVELGANDALRGLDLAATKVNLERIVAASQQAGAQVLLLGMMVPPNYGSAYTEAFSRLFRDVAQSRKVPLVPFFLQGIVEGSDYFQADRIHPNERAQSALLENVWPALEPLLAHVS